MGGSVQRTGRDTVSKHLELHRLTEGLPGHLQESAEGENTECEALLNVTRLICPGQVSTA